MNISKSLTSHMMTELILWRNPGIGDEEAVINESGTAEKNLSENMGPTALVLSYFDDPLFSARIFTTEIAMVLLAAVASIEVIAYGALMGLSILASYFDEQPLEYFQTLLDSSLFTIRWIMHDLHGNLFIKYGCTQESFARLGLSMFALQDGLEEHFIRPQDRAFLNEWSRNTNLGNPIQYLEREIFLKNEIFTNFTDKTRELYESGDDQEVLKLGKLKILSIYLIGAHRNDSLPDFLEENQKEKILNLRAELFPEGMSTEDKEYFCESHTENLKEIINDIELAREGISDTNPSKNLYRKLLKSIRE